jgi:pyruvate carboxylase
MKMEAAITTPVAGRIERLAISATQQVEAGDLLVVITPVV